jgi:S-adenosylmethionine-dependent methyltransferase
VRPTVPTAPAAPTAPIGTISDSVTTTRQQAAPTVVAELVAALALEHQPVRVLDCGGGSGRVAVPLAELGADVTVVDISADALATLTRRAEEAGVADRVHAVQGDVESIADAIGSDVFDLALVHSVLDAVLDPVAALASVASTLRPGGLLSIVVVNPVASVLAKVLAGDLEAAVLDLRLAAGSAGRSDQLDGPALERLCAEVGLTVEQVRGEGVFSEFIPTAAADGVTQAGVDIAQIVAEMETLCASMPPYRDIAARLNVVARRGSQR